MMALVIVFVIMRHRALLPSVVGNAQDYSMREGLPSAPAESARAGLTLRVCSISRGRRSCGDAQQLRIKSAEGESYFAGAAVAASVE
jgi:hypothetical protein